MRFVARRRRDATNEGNAETGKRRGRGSTAVYDDLREDIMSLQIAPGSALDEVALAERFGLSRTPIREALVMLSTEQLVSFLPSRSAIVAQHTMENTPEYLDALVLHARAVSRLAAQERTVRVGSQEPVDEFCGELRLLALVDVVGDEGRQFRHLDAHE